MGLPQKAEYNAKSGADIMISNRLESDRDHANCKTGPIFGEGRLPPEQAEIVLVELSGELMNPKGKGCSINQFDCRSDADSATSNLVAGPRLRSTA